MVTTKVGDSACQSVGFDGNGNVIEAGACNGDGACGGMAEQGPASIQIGVGACGKQHDTCCA